MKIEPEEIKIAMEKVYIVQVEIEVLPTSETYEGSGRMFCSVYCFCEAEAKQSAVGRVKSDLIQQDIKLLKVISIVKADGVVWDIQDKPEDPSQYAEEAFNTGQVVYSIFYCYYE